MSEYIEGPRSRRNKRKRNSILALIIGSATLIVAATVFVVVLGIRNAPPPNPSVGGDSGASVGSNTDFSSDTGSDSSSNLIDPTEKVSTATVSVVGDILTHLSVLTAAEDKASGIHNFDPFFTYVSPYVSKSDYAVANLEVTLGGTENGRTYTGYPRFNAPDSIATALKTAGFDMALTSNNHCYDTGLSGLQRTLRVISNNGLNTLGTVYDKDAAKYIVKKVNGIRIGMVCYTFETGDSYPNRPSINGLLTSEASVGHINSFDYNQLDKFYTEMETHLANMAAEGAQATVLYIHWGNEYQLAPTSVQKKIAQKMCDLGVDVIVGGHPHVIQPMDLLESTVDKDHKTVCIYSTGNFLSNQRRNLMDLKTGHTEDGMIFSFTFAQYGDGTVTLEDVNVLPTWIYLHKEGGKNVYSILPLDKGTEDWKTAFRLDSAAYSNALESYERTMALVEEGLTETKTYLGTANNIPSEPSNQET